MNRLATIIGDYQIFLRQVLKEVADEGFELTDFVQIDHLCYRVSSVDTYHLKKQELTGVGVLLGESLINWRPIATFRLHEPIRFENWRIDAVELPAPKPNHPTQEGLEHIEFVLFDDKEVFLRKYHHKTFELQAADRGINPEITYRLPTYTVKFHLLSLPTVVYLEKKLGITKVNDGDKNIPSGLI